MEHDHGIYRQNVSSFFTPRNGIDCGNWHKKVICVSRLLRESYDWRRRREERVLFRKKKKLFALYRLMQNVCVQNGLKYCPLQHNLNRYKKNPFKFIHTEDNTTIRINWLIIFHFCCCCWSCFLGVFNSRVIKYKLSFVLQSFEIALPARYGTFLQSKDMDGIEPLLHIPEVGFYI